MAISFPASPTTNQTFTYNNVTWVYDGNKWRKGSTVYSGGGATVSVSATAPDTTTQGSLWFDVDQGDLAVYSGTGWLNIGQGSGDPGYTGSIGPSGGYTGSAGAGYTGSAGTGYTGSASAVAGYTGSAGTGYTGSAGTTGSAGYTGSAGAGSSTPASVSSQSNTATDFFGIPRGTTAQRPSVPDYGALRYNSTTGYAEVYTSGGWTVMGAAPPTITTVTPDTYNGESGTMFTINGTNFTSDAVVKFIDVNNTEFTAAIVSFVNSTQLTATTPQDFTVAQEPLDVRVAQLSGTTTKLDCIDTGGSPTWTTATGQIGGTIYKTNAVSTSVAATDPDSGATIAYSIVSGALPSGLSLNTSTGAITGTAPVVASDTTYNFTIRVTDNAGNTADRAFSMVILVGVPGAPTIGTATRSASQAVQVAFTAPASIGGSSITSYTATSSPGSITGTAASSPITVTGLTNGTAYTFTVTATNSYGTSAASAASNSATPYTVPGAPTVGTATATGTTTATVAFTAPASNGGSAITSYTATSSPGNITATLSQAGSGTITVSGLTQTTAYTFTVYATNAAGNGASSAASNSITTQTPVLSSIQLLMIAGGGGGGNWGGGGGGAGGLLYYGPNSSPKTPNGGALAVSSGQSFSITIGAGNGLNSNGGNTTFVGGSYNLTATGGGYGGSVHNNSSTGSTGGSGGGAGGASLSGSAGTSGQGNSGGSSGPSGSNGPGQGGGGGAGGVGGNYSGYRGGTGGAGLLYSEFGAYGTDSSNSNSASSGKGYFASGGSGGGVDIGGSPVLAPGGGGGAGGYGSYGSQRIGQNALANTGGGGGGTGDLHPINSGNTVGSGGNGIVLIRYQSPSALATGGTIDTTSSPGWVIHAFTDSGTFRVN